MHRVKRLEALIDRYEQKLSALNSRTVQRPSVLALARAITATLDQSGGPAEIRRAVAECFPPGSVENAFRTELEERVAKCRAGELGALATWRRSRQLRELKAQVERAEDRVRQLEFYARLADFWYWRFMNYVSFADRSAPELLLFALWMEGVWPGLDETREEATAWREYKDNPDAFWRETQERAARITAPVPFCRDQSDERER